METNHRLFFEDARSMHHLDDDSVELVVTSPPYPMIEMWDDAFAGMSDEARAALETGDGETAYDAMHAELDRVWDEVERVLAPGGTVCVNVGDATRTFEETGFRVYPNHVRVTRAFEERGFRSLPDIVWRKPANSAAKFMGSGMMPPNAYVTLEHEHILVFRKGERVFDDTERERRYESAYFWEERNGWFSDTWEVRGERQVLDGEARERSGAFPFEVPYRLVCMYSVYGDTVLDPFLGTGTTTLAAAVAGRSSVGYEFDGSMRRIVDERVRDAPELSREVVAGRMDDHERFVEERGASEFGYSSTRYGFPVMTAQEQEILFYEVESIERAESGSIETVERADETEAEDGETETARRAYVALHSEMEHERRTG